MQENKQVTKTILIVDDELYIRELLANYAHHEGYLTITKSNGKEAIEAVNNNKVDLIIMDIMMPVMDGFMAVKEIRKNHTLPIILLSSRSEEYDKVYGFDQGIDDYVTKPFSSKELFRRVSAILKRSNITNFKKEELDSLLSYKGLVISLTKHVITIDNVEIVLTNKEYEILVLLLQNKDTIVSRKDIVSIIWQNSIGENDRTIDTHIKSIRKKILNYGLNIITLRRVGYRFDTKEH